MSKRNETVNRIYQGTKTLREALSMPQRRKLRQAIEDAYDAGKAHGYRDQLDLADLTADDSENPSKENTVSDPEKHASEYTVEDWEKQFLLDKIDNTADRLERLAADIRRKKMDMEQPTFSSYTQMVGNIIHDVTWGVANLTLGTMLRGASAADLDRAERKPKDDA